MKKLCFSIVFCLFSGCCLASSTVLAAADPFQRYLRFHNEYPFTVWPVIQIPLASNGGLSTDIRDARLFVNQAADGNGVPPGQEVLVNIPKNGVGKYSWYQSGRIFLFSVNPRMLETRVNDPNEKTIPDSPPLPNPCPNEPVGACWTGIANAAWWVDAPFQLVEYTAMSKDWSGTNKSGVWPNQDDPRGVPFLDIDVSYVDSVYLPVAMALDDNGATKFMGTTMTFTPTTFQQATNNFLNNSIVQWQNFAAYSASNWSNNYFHDLVAPYPHIPSGFNIIQMPLTSAFSGMYVNGPNNFIIGNTTRTANPNIYDNPSMAASYQRWVPWLTETPCADINTISSWPSNNPAFDQPAKQAFCNAFQATVQWVWNTYLADPGVQADCANYTGFPNYNYCVTKSIVGYTVGPKAGQQPESVQALMRNLPWGDGKATKQYQWDKFLHYWAPNDSIFNLNPYIDLVKNPVTGIAAKSGYSFSIDDQWGNYQDLASGAIIDMGGSTVLPNLESFDPYEQYRLSLAAGWDHATVCGRLIQLRKQAQPITFSFWQHAKRIQYCDIVLYPTASNSYYFGYRLTESQTSVTDTWTGDQHSVTGLYAPDPTYCTNHSSPASMQNLCLNNQVSLTPKIPANDGSGLEVVFVSVDPGQRPAVTMNVPPAPPVNNLGLANDAGAECLFGWAEKTYASHLFPPGPPTEHANNYSIRRYSGSKTVLAFSTLRNQAYYQDTDGVQKDGGKLTDLLVLAGCSLIPPPEVECLFNWVENNFPAHLAPSGATTQMDDKYMYRYYPGSNSYFGVSKDQTDVAAQGPDGKIQHFGSVDDWLPVASCQ